MIKGSDRNIPLSELHPFKDHPYKVEDNMEMDALCEVLECQPGDLLRWVPDAGGAVVEVSEAESPRT